MATKTYDPARVNVIINVASDSGAENKSIVVSGYAADSFIDLTYTAEQFGAARVSADRKTMTRTHSGNDSGALSLVLMDDSETNDQLLDLLKSDKDDLKGLCAVSVRDNSGDKGLFSEMVDAYLAGEPQMGAGAEAGSYTWTFYSPSVTVNSLSR
ncbi:MAG: hypothetical protein B7733_05890 [Myxococcales bacterium FL481]|nr:MAG: hypothetical protein B7733_05890 [Myxococcales bacterium FL481]